MKGQMDDSIGGNSKLGASAVAGGTHTPEPWEIFDVNGVIEIQSPDNVVIRWAGFDGSGRAWAEQRANARRIVACVNWCKDISTEFMEGSGDIGTLHAQRDELAKLLTECLEMADNWPGVAYSYDLVSRCTAVLAKLEAA